MTVFQMIVLSVTAVWVAFLTMWVWSLGPLIGQLRRQVRELQAVTVALARADHETLDLVKRIARVIDDVGIPPPPP